MSNTDVLIVGSGPAGITAAIYAFRKGLSVRIFEKGLIGGVASDAIMVENYPGFEGLSGMDLMQKMKKHLEKFGMKIELNEVKAIVKKLNVFEIEAGKEKFNAKSVILATGTKNKMLGIPGENELKGKGIAYCATCDGFFYKGKDVAVIGAGNSGVMAAIYLSDICKKVYLVEFLDEMMCDEIYKKKLEKLKGKNLELHLGTALTEISGSGKVNGIKIKNRKSNAENEIALDGVFMYAGLIPQSELAKKAGAKITEKGFIKVSENMETSVKGIFAAGDVTGELAQIVSAAGSGAKAAVSAYNYIKGI
ncbi:MAG: FAD-dependent oxidoreductase [Candidatus Diapherotrites archaeon]